MDPDGLWRLFFATGLPEAYLALREGGRLPWAEEPAKTAFLPAAQPGQKL